MEYRTRKTVMRLAERARKRAEYIAEQEFMPSDLAGMCARASAVLFNLLREAGFNPFICFGRHHCFVELDDVIIDITASQFGYADVMIVPRNKLIYMLCEADRKDTIDGIGWWNHDDYIFNDLKEAIAYQEEHSWPREQKINCLDFL